MFLYAVFSGDENRTVEKMRSSEKDFRKAMQKALDFYQKSNRSPVCVLSRAELKDTYPALHTLAWHIKGAVDLDTTPVLA